MPMRTKEQLAQYQREYNKRPEVIARKNEAARQRYAYQKNSPRYQQIIKERHIRYYIGFLTRNGYTVISPKEVTT